MTRPIYVTQPDLPPLEEFIPYLREIWDSRILTNKGPHHEHLEAELAKYLGVEHVCLFTNATIALVVALQALRIRGDVITTPYSFVATAHSLLWNGIRPVFADIDPETLNLDPARIEAAITPDTTAIMPVHVYGTPCDIDAIRRIGDKYNLRVIYDAAHAFGVQHRGRSLAAHGDLSVLSFHATKVFNTFEGGAIICPDARTKQHIDHLKNFGFVDETTVVAAGINGKMSEFNAALGLLQLAHLPQSLSRRREIAGQYRVLLKDVKGIRLMPPAADCEPNNGYFPVFVTPEYRMGRDDLYHLLKSRNIHPRRYFYPLISQFPMYRHIPSAAAANLPVATRIAEEVLCLPIYPALAQESAAEIAAVVRGN